MGIFDRFFKDERGDSVKRFTSSAEAFISTFIIGLSLSEHYLDEADFNDKQKNIFKSAITPGILDGVAQSQNNLSGNNDITQGMISTQLMDNLYEVFNLSESETREISSIVFNKCETENSFNRLQEFGGKFVFKFYLEETQADKPNVMRALNLSEVYEDKGLLSEFLKSLDK